MARPRSPAFQFYPRDFLADLRVQAMSYEARGVYWTLCCLYWLERGLPDDPSYLAKALNLSRRKFDKLWSEIAACFTRTDKGLKHKRLDAERAKKTAWRAKCSEGGKLGMARRWARAPKTDDKGSYDLVIRSDNSAFAFASAEKEQEQRTAAAPPALPVENPTHVGNHEGRPNLRVLLRLAHTFHGEHFDSEADFKEALKRAAAKLHLVYDTPTITRVLELLAHSRRPVVDVLPRRAGGTR